MLWWLILPFYDFAVFYLLPLTMCIKCSFLHLFTVKHLNCCTVTISDDIMDNLQVTLKLCYALLVSAFVTVTVMVYWHLFHAAACRHILVSGQWFKLCTHILHRDDQFHLFDILIRVPWSLVPQMVPQSSAPFILWQSFSLKTLWMNVFFYI